MKKISDKKFVIVGLIILALMWIFAGIRTCRINKKLEHSKKGVAILTKHKRENAKMPSGGYFEYTVNGKTYSFLEYGYYEHLDVLDSVEIKYSIEDPSVAEVVNSHYMDRYKTKGVVDPDTLSDSE